MSQHQAPRHRPHSAKAVRHRPEAEAFPAHSELVELAAAENGPELELAEILPGSWQVCIQTPFALGRLQIVFTQQGSFRGELLSPAGPSIIEGRWQAESAARQITLQGRQADESHVMPYRTVMRVTFFDAQQIVGTTADGDQVTWHKQTPAA